MIMEEMMEAIEAMEADEPQANLYRAAEEYVSDLTRELVGIGDSDDFDVLVELMKQAVIYGAHWKEQQMMKDAIACTVYQNEFDGFEFDGVLICRDGITLDETKYKAGDKVKVIIIKED